ncbi:MAP kinase phosphatase [Raphidocelis subcapitata]|uniref:MAP kinase phosphatase n=1 Tax=Raphidocelis subcapitata TaxID=307507 RepID=A0A2V0PHK8_9CHLO|nr:MAP kinase phosphatase [Raphidocelis subcapitata]|eukprot:GBF96717.1 MAP kinase phosphatase [Raphidocelis subcapitata]
MALLSGRQWVQARPTRRAAAVEAALPARCGPARAARHRAPAPRTAPAAGAARRAATAAAAAVGEAAPPAAALPPLPPLDGSYEAQAAFSSDAAWLVPGRLLLGRYPYTSPDDLAASPGGVTGCHERWEAALDEIVTRGARVFAAVMDEAPPQGKLPIGGRGGYVPYKPVVELIAAAHAPTPPGAVVNGVRHPNLEAFLPPRRRAAAPGVAEYFESERVAFAHWAVAPGAAPDADTLSDIVSDLSSRVRRGQGVYLHSRKGAGRGGAVGAALLVELYGLSADEALERVQRAHDTRNAGGEGFSPETEAQREAVRAFAAARRAGGGKQ